MPKLSLSNTRNSLFTCLFILTFLSACGGGGGSSTPATPPALPPSTPPITPPTPPPSEVPETQLPQPGATALETLRSGVYSFETVPTRSMVLSLDRSQLYVLNTADNRLEIFDVNTAGTLTASQSILVGADPISLALNPDNADLWVVNHLSDSISIIDPQQLPLRIKRTLLVGDEPRDIVFARAKAFISTAHRGQHRTHASIAAAFDNGNGDPDFHKAGEGRTDVWVFDSANLGSTVGGTPLKVIELMGDTARALSVSADQTQVFVAVFNSGNQTSVVHEAVMCRGFDDTPSGVTGTGEFRAGNAACVAGNIPAADASASPNGFSSLSGSGKELPSGRPSPGANSDGDAAPWTSMMVKYDQATEQWQDSRGLNYSNGIRFNLPDHDVFAIDSNSLALVSDYEHVGTTLFNMVVHPENGKVFVSNTESNNHVRFEGPGQHGGSTVQGNLARSQISILDPTTGSVKVRAINRHINYSTLKASEPTKSHTVATPTAMTMSDDGEVLYVAALGSNKVAIYDTNALENDALWDGQEEEFDPAEASKNHIDVSGGPQDVLYSSQHNGSDGVLFVHTRYDNAIKVLNATTGAILETQMMLNPEPEKFQAGRFMLYDAQRSSSNGEASCASCHVFGDLDQLAWNLGNPDGKNSSNSNPFPIENIFNLGCDLVGPQDDSCVLASIVNGNGKAREFSSMKGPMTTQTMRGMSTHGHMHWRGDRVSGYFGSELDDNQDGDGNPDTRDMEALDERLSFKNFIVAYEGLLGLDIDLDGGVNSAAKSDEVRQLEQDVDKFADFMIQVQLPPNPIRGLDNSLSASAQVGQAFVDGRRRSDGVLNDVTSNGPEVDGMNCEGCHTHDAAKGFYGTDGKVGSGGEVLILKVPHFRNLYQKVGMFGLPNREGFLPSTTDAHQGDQIRGFGFLHDGATDTLFNFLSGGVFDNGETDCSETRSGLPNWTSCELNSGAMGIPNDEVRLAIVDYLLAFESDLAPVVGQQMTITADASAAMLARVSLLEQRGETNFTSKILGGDVKECDVIASGVIDGEVRQYLYQSATKQYKSDKHDEAEVSAADLLALAQVAPNAMTYSCVVPGTGHRLALDRDYDKKLNRDE